MQKLLPYLQFTPSINKSQLHFTVFQINLFLLPNAVCSNTIPIAQAELHLFSSAHAQWYQRQIFA